MYSHYPIIFSTFPKECIKFTFAALLPLNNSLRFRALNGKAVMNQRNEIYLDDNNLSRKERRTALY